MQDNDKLIAALQQDLQRQSAARLERYVKGLDHLVAWRQAHADALAAMVKDNPALSQHAHALDSFTTRLGDAAQRQAQGQSTRLAAWHELHPQWQALSSDAALNRVAAWHAKLPPLASGFEPAWLANAFDLDGEAPRQWDISTGVLGLFGLKPLLKRARDDFVQRRDALDDDDVPPPMKPLLLDVCGTPSLPPLTPGTTSGLAVVSVAPDVTGARFRTMSSTIAAIAMGGATDSSALAGLDVSWPSGFAELSVSCDVTVDIGSLFSVAILGGATASAELVLQMQLNSGASFRTTVPLGSAVAPLVWHTSLNVNGPFQMSLGAIPLAGAAGSARIFVGAHDNTAAVGVLGSSGAQTFIVGRVTRLCAHLR